MDVLQTVFGVLSFIVVVVALMYMWRKATHDLAQAHADWRQWLSDLATKHHGRVMTDSMNDFMNLPIDEWEHFVTFDGFETHCIAAAEFRIDDDRCVMFVPEGSHKDRFGGLIYTAVRIDGIVLPTFQLQWEKYSPGLGLSTSHPTIADDWLADVVPDGKFFGEDVASIRRLFTPELCNDLRKEEHVNALETSGSWALIAGLNAISQADFTNAFEATKRLHTALKRAATQRGFRQNSLRA